MKQKLYRIAYRHLEKLRRDGVSERQLTGRCYMTSAELLPILKEKGWDIKEEIMELTWPSHDDISWRVSVKHGENQEKRSTLYVFGKTEEEAKEHALNIAQINKKQPQVISVRRYP